MKYHIYIIISCTFLFFSCQKDNNNLNEIASLNTPNSQSISRMLMKQSFKKDFPVKKDNRPTGTKPSNFLFKYKGIKSMPYDKFLTVYPQIKKEINTINKRKDQSPELQSVALRILRYHFLDSANEESIAESLFLLNILIENEAVDLDVLVDAFIKSRNIMSESEKVKNLYYLKKLYTSNKEGLTDRFKEMEQKYKSSKSVSEKNKFLYLGKHLERKNKSLIYAKEVIPHIDANS